MSEATRPDLFDPYAVTALTEELNNTLKALVAQGVAYQRSDMWVHATGSYAKAVVAANAINCVLSVHIETLKGNGVEDLPPLDLIYEQIEMVRTLTLDSESW